MARRVEEIILIHTPTQWSYQFYSDRYFPSCRHPGCGRKGAWCVRFHYHYGGGYVSQYWCGVHLPEHHRAQTNIARRQGMSSYTFPIPLSPKEALAKYRQAGLTITRGDLSE